MPLDSPDWIRQIIAETQVGSGVSVDITNDGRFYSWFSDRDVKNGVGAGTNRFTFTPSLGGYGLMITAIAARNDTTVMTYVNVTMDSMGVDEIYLGKEANVPVGLFGGFTGKLEYATDMLIYVDCMGCAAGDDLVAIVAGYLYHK